MRNEMRVGDGVLFPSLSCPEPGIAGLRRSRPAGPHVDPSQFDGRRDYYDAKATRAAPRWFCVDVRALKKTRLMPIAEMQAQPALRQMLTLRPGNRLSITPVTAAEWKLICSRLA
jgi:predicted RNA-binding protein with PUA-like domain